MKIFDLKQIQASINITKDLEELIASQKSAFIDFSSGLYNVPSPMQFMFPTFGSDCHVKGGYKQDHQNLVIKIANSTKSGNNGAVLVFDINTGEIKAILKDKGFMTTLRTAIAGILVADLIPWKPKNIGIIGSGSLAAQLYKLASKRYPEASITLYARNKAKASDVSKLICNSTEELLTKCDIIFAATSSTQPVIHTVPKDKNMAIVLLGSDDEHKSELSSNLFREADMVITDSKIQAAKFGDIARALQSQIITSNQFVEIGSLLELSIPKLNKTIIADFSGIGAQDVAISEFILKRLA